MRMVLCHLGNIKLAYFCYLSIYATYQFTLVGRINTLLAC
jgi:hypothetical protein